MLGQKLINLIVESQKRHLKWDERLLLVYVSMYIINPEQCHVINATYFKKKSTSMPHILDFAMSL